MIRFYRVLSPQKNSLVKYINKTLSELHLWPVRETSCFEQELSIAYFKQVSNEEQLLKQ